MSRRPTKRSPEAQAYHEWYNTTEWRSIRIEQLRRKPLCEWHKARGHIVPANTVHHAEPHKGDRTKFLRGPFVSLCEACHNSDAQQIERRGYSTRIGADGWPTDPNHPGLKA